MSLKVSTDDTKFKMSKRHKSIRTVSYYPCRESGFIQSNLGSLTSEITKTFFLVFFVSLQIVRNVVALAHFFAWWLRCTTRWKDVTKRKYLCISLRLVLIKGELVLPFEKSG